eukprot:TRINITY_DN5733_c0_g1_i10.p1 TRINITY_DN5733_c0_g1~~TRINITY_DN5733_c0_g1_i10.p1  ORF type:complete len:233 (-),score=43.39 TRINITY_DN5733_c0_g1_i10:215-913(-)
MWKPIQDRMAALNSLQIPNNLDVSNKVQSKSSSYEDLAASEESGEQVTQTAASEATQTIAPEQIPVAVQEAALLPEGADALLTEENLAALVMALGDPKYADPEYYDKELTEVTKKDKIILPEQKLNFVAPIDYIVEPEAKLINKVVTAKPQKAVVKIPVHVYAQPIVFPVKKRRPVYGKPVTVYGKPTYMPYYEPKPYGMKRDYYKPKYYKPSYPRKPSYGHHKKGRRSYYH